LENSIKAARLAWDDIDRAIQKVLLAVNNTISDRRGQWLLDANHDQSSCELVIVHMQGNKIDLKLRDNIIDRSFITDGIRWIIDYKSSEPGPEQSTEDFLIQETKAYQPQLARYKACFEALGEANIKLALYFPLLKKEENFLEIDM
jgi:ATP-dependent helicase/nuclease subunit A